MSVKGVDFAWAKPSITALELAKDVFAAQYFSPDPTKDLTGAQAKALLAASVEIIVVWEYRAEAMKGGYAAGKADAGAAQAQANGCGLGGIPIYFACDYDAPPGDQGQINAYLDGAGSVIGADRVGIYGGFWPLSRARAAAKARYYWGTPAWSGSNWATCGWLPDIMQGPYTVVGGVTCDLDAGLSTDYGQWPRPAANTVKTWQAYTTNGTVSLHDIALDVKMTSAGILAHTAAHYRDLDTTTRAYVNGLANGTTKPTAHIPKGARLWVLR